MHCSDQSSKQKEKHVKFDPALSVETNSKTSELHSPLKRPIKPLQVNMVRALVWSKLFRVVSCSADLNPFFYQTAKKNLYSFNFRKLISTGFPKR